MKTVFVLGTLCCLVCLASGQTIGIQGPTSITVGTELVITCQPSIVGLKQVDRIELWKNTSTSAYSQYVSTYFVQDGMKSVIAWQNTVVKNRPGVNASGAVYPPANAQLRLTISQGNTVCTDAGAYKCVMLAVAKAVGAVAVTVEIEKYIAVNTAPDNTRPMTVNPSFGVNGQQYIYSVGTVVTFTCTMTVGTSQVDVQWCYKQANDNSFTGYPYFSHVNQGSGSIVSVGCNYRRTSVLTYNVTSLDTSTQFMCEPKSGSLCGSSADALRSNFTIRNNVATGDPSGQGSAAASASAGVIAGAVIGGFAGILLIILIIYFLVIRRSSPGETYVTKEDGSAENGEDRGPAHTEGPVYSVPDKNRSRQGLPPGRPPSLPRENTSMGEVKRELHYADLDIATRPPGVLQPKPNRDPPTHYAAVKFV